MTVDQGSFALAGRFLGDVTDNMFLNYPQESRMVKQKELAEAIQRAVEDWLCENVIPF